METSWKSRYNKAWSIEVLLTEQGWKTKQTQTAALTLSENNILFSAFHFCAKRGRVQRGTRALSRSQTVCQLRALLSPDAPTSASGVCSLRQSKSFSVSFFKLTWDLIVWNQWLFLHPVCVLLALWFFFRFYLYQFWPRWFSERSKDYQSPLYHHDNV